MNCPPGFPSSPFTGFMLRKIYDGGVEKCGVGGAAVHSIAPVRPLRLVRHVRLRLARQLLHLADEHELLLVVLVETLFVDFPQILLDSQGWWGIDCRRREGR